MEKKGYIEWLRVISMVAVVFTHIGSTAHTDFPNTYYGSMGGVLFQSIVNISHFAVPVFFMITGALLLDSQKEITINKILKKYVLRYCWVLLIFGWGFSYLELFAQTKKIIISDFFISFVNMLQGKTWAHMWYLYTLIGMMLILPIMRAVTKKCSQKEIIYILVILFAFTSVFPIIDSIFGFNFGIVFPINSVYMLYMFIGYLIDSINLKVSWPIFCVVEVLCIIILIFLAYFDVMQGLSIPMASYNSPLIIIFSVMLFNQMKLMNPSTNMIVRFLSYVSFGVYITHMIWINLAFKFLKLDPTKPTSLTGIAIAIVALVLSVLLTWILKKMPIFKKIL